jgi:hypothetical protein
MGDPVPPTLTSPLAFEPCEKGKCGKVKERKVTKGSDPYTAASCDQDADKCGGKGCYCQLFKRKKNKDKATWDVVKLNDKKEDTDYDPEKYEYECFCVAPILEAEHKEDGVTYTVRYQLCDTAGSCSMERHSVAADPDAKDTYSCTGKCDGECKCTMFRLKVKKMDKQDKWKEQDAKWEYVAPADKERTPQDHYYYRCFCVK